MISAGDYMQLPLRAVFLNFQFKQFEFQLGDIPSESGTNEINKSVFFPPTDFITIFVHVIKEWECVIFWLP